MEEKKIDMWKCDGCGYETNDSEAPCPHCNIIVSSGKKYTPKPTIKVCEHCKQELPSPLRDDNSQPRPRGKAEIAESSENPIDRPAVVKDVFNKSRSEEKEDKPKEGKKK